MHIKRTTLARALLLALASIGPSAHAIGLTVGDATLDINGIVNGYYVYRTSQTPGAPKTETAASPTACCRAGSTSSSRPRPAAWI